MNKYNSNIHHRRLVRLKGYDYSQEGLYFITICAQNRTCLFGEIIAGEMRLNQVGEIVAQEWIKSAEIRKEIKIYEYIVMPNHFHAINPNKNCTNNDASVGAYGIRPDGKRINDDVGVPVAYGIRPDENCTNNENYIINKTGTINEKGVCHTPLRSPSRTMGALVRGFKSSVTKQLGFSPWQRNYHEHIIRNENSFQIISEYIMSNPQKWNEDMFNPLNNKKI